MSELRVALVVEGPTDSIIIQSALEAVLQRPFISTVLQPEATRPLMGTGWCGVLKWCREFSARGFDSLENDPTLPGFDLFIIHVDADVAEKSYTDGGRNMELTTQCFPPLPFHCPCPPPSAAADEIRKRLLAWIGTQAIGHRTVLCVPSKAIDAWLAAAVLDHDHSLLEGVECYLDLEARLRILPKKQRIKKTQSEYHRHRSTVTANWSKVCATCSQAERFSVDVENLLP